MAENLIQQKLGFDVSDAIKSLDDMMSAIDRFNAALKDNKSALTDYSSDATKSMDKLSKAAQTMKAAISKPSKLKADTSGLDQAIPSLRSFAAEIEKHIGEVPAKASEALKRSVRQNVTLMAEFARSQKLALKDVGTAWNRFGESLSEPERKLREMMKQNKQAVSDGMKDMAKNTKTFTISWQSMLRIVVTQVIVRAMSALRTAMQEGIRDAIDFGQRIGEIGTIARGSLGSLNQMSEVVKNISREFGIGASETAEGLYQTLSNQVGNATESLHVFRQASKLAIATNSTGAEAVGLMTAALNGFGLSAAHAERVGGVLFKTVEKGRLRVKDLADIFGRTAPLYAQMGGTFEEMSAALATMTVTGVKADTAMTQLRAIMLKLVKPSEDLKRLMHDKLGIDSAVEAVQKFGGVLPFLHELNKLTGDNVTEMAELFDRVRAVAGVLGLTSTNAERAVENMRAMREEGPTALREAFELMESTDARNAIKAFNELKLSVLSLGQAVLPVVTKFVEGLNHIIAQGKDAAGALIAMGVAGVAAMLSLKAGALGSVAALVKAKAAAIGLGQTILTMAPYLLAFWAGWKLGEIYVERWGKTAEERLARVKNIIAKHVAADEEFWNMRAANMSSYYVQAEGARTEDSLSFLADLKLRSQAEIESVHAIRKDTISTVKGMLDTLSNARQNVINKIEKWQANADARQQKYTETIAKQKNAIDERAFQQRLGYMGTERQTLELLARSDAKANKTRVSSIVTITRILNTQTGQYEWIRKSSTQLTEDTLKRKEAELKSALALNKQAQGTARQLGDKRLLRRAENAELEIMRQQVQVTKQRAQLEKDIADQLADQLAKQRAALQADLESTRVISKLLRFTKDDKSAKTEDEIRADTEKAFKVLDEMGARAANNPDLKLGNIMGFAELDAAIRRFSTTGIDDIKNIIRINTAESIKILRKDFETMTPEVKQALSDMWELVTDEKLVFNPVAAFPQASEVILQYTKWTRTVGAGLIEEHKKLQGQMSSLLSAALIPDSELEILSTTTLKNAAVPFKDTIIAMIASLNSLKEKAKASDAYLQTDKGQAELAALKAKAAEAGIELDKLDTVGKAGGLFAGSFIKGNLVAELQAFTDNLDSISETQTKMDLAGGGQLQRMKDTSQAAKTVADGLGRMAEAFTGIAPNSTTTATAATTINNQVQAAVGPTQNMATAWTTIAAAAQAAAAAGPPGGGASTANVETKAKGGLMGYYANGGFTPKGTDTIPAMLSPGEFVMNARSTRKFYSQLVSMNSGRQPIYRSEGGPVTNVGDINITVPGGTTDRESARNIVTRVRRELRRRSSTLG